MRVAITGASGFIGRYMVRELVARGAEVVAVSRHPDPPISTAVMPLALDISDAGPDTFARIGHPDALLHMAWDGLPDYRSSHHLDTELPRHIAFLDACINSGLRRLVVTGTCLEYGLQTGELDEANLANPTTAYGKAKHQLHQHLLDLRETHTFGLTWLRLFYLFGLGQASNSLHSQLLTAVQSGARSFDMSAGDQVRDFLAIEIAVAHIATLVLNHVDVGTVNVCSGRPKSVADAVHDWLQDWHADIALNRGVYPYPDYESFAFWGSVSRLHTLLRVE